MIEIRRAEASDFDGIWGIFHEVVQGGDTYVYPPDTTREQAYGFAIVGTLPKAFRHSWLGLVDAYVMHRSL